MFYVGIVYVLFIIVCAVLYFSAQKKLTGMKKSIYEMFENYFFALHQYFSHHKDDFYRKEKGSELLFAQKKIFFSQKKYTIETFSDFEKKFIEDALYFNDLFPEEPTQLQAPVYGEKNYRLATVRERMYYTCDTLLTVATFGIRKVF